MAGDDSTATLQSIESLLRLIRDVSRLSASGFKGRFKKECTDLSRKVALLSHLLEEIRDSQADRRSCSSSSFRCFLSELTAALKAARALLQSAGSFDHIISPERAAVEFISQFQSVTSKLEKTLGNFPYGDFEIPNDVTEQINLVRGQLKRATQQYGTINNGHDHQGIKSKVVRLNSIVSVEEKMKKMHDSSDEIPVDFLCPISRQLFSDPVMVSTGQTYERSYIQRWINNGNKICPKSCQTLENLTLTPNYVLRSVIAEWCTDHNVKPPTLPTKKIKPIVGKPLSQPIQEQRQVVSVQLLIGTAFALLILMLLISLIYLCSHTFPHHRKIN